jgi:hypothetical protein
MQVIPNMPGVEATGSERKVLSLLRSIDWGGGSARALNSLNLAEHSYQRWGEIDFLLVGAKGLIAIEVKGGDVSCKNGRWSYQDRLGRIVTRNKSPLVQAKDAFFSLDKYYLAPMLGIEFATRYPAGFCVILAGMGRSDLERILGGPEFPMELIGTREDLASPAKLQRFLDSVAQFWAHKNNSSRKIPEREVADLVRLLRPEFERVQALALARDIFNEEMLSLTEEQYEILDHWEGAERIFCSSPAGCGKTLLAVEMVRRSIAAGDSVLFVLGTDALASALREKSDIRGVITSLNEIKALHTRQRSKVSILIIDEGQQILSREMVLLLDSLIEGGIKQGRWAWFGDVSYQSPCPREEMDAGVAILSSAASVRPRLSKNCRNTPEIITSVELAAGVPLGHAIVTGRGLSPTMLSVKDRADAAKEISKRIREWMDADISLSSITLLTNDENPEDLANNIGLIGGFGVRPWGSARRQDAQLAYTSIDSFRGLESGFLILYLTESSIGDDELGRMLYLGMTRANFALAILAVPEILQRVHARMADNAARHFDGVASG